MLDKKGISLIPFIFVIILVSFGIVSWVVYNTYFGTEYQEVVSLQSSLDMITDELENIKNSVGLSLRYSSHHSMQKHARQGGIIPDRPMLTYDTKAWVCQDTVDYPSLSEVTECLENYTMYQTSDYFNYYDVTDLPVTLNKSNFTEMIYDIRNTYLNAGEYDEGNFNVFLGGGRASLESEDMGAFETIDFNKTLNKTRFWLLYRNFREWALDQGPRNDYSECIEECVAAGGGCSCADSCAASIASDLEYNYFGDEYISCEIERECCWNTHGSDYSCTRDGSTSEWNQDVCVDQCDVSCKDPDNYFAEYNSGSSNSYSTCSNEPILLAEEYYSETNASENNDWYYECIDTDCYGFRDNYLASVHTISCIDEKYNVPDVGAPSPLIFQMNVFASYEARYADRVDFPCTDLEEDPQEEDCRCLINGLDCGSCEAEEVEIIPCITCPPGEEEEIDECTIKKTWYECVEYGEECCLECEERSEIIEGCEGEIEPTQPEPPNDDDDDPPNDEKGPPDELEPE